jgi:hypothetical protein
VGIWPEPRSRSGRLYTDLVVQELFAHGKMRLTVLLLNGYSAREEGYFTKSPSRPMFVQFKGGCCNYV